MLRETQQCVRSLPPEEGVGGAEAKSRGRGRARGRLFRPSTVWQAEKRGRGERCGAEEVLQEAAVAVATELRRWPDSSECSTVKRRGKKKWRAKKKKITGHMLTRSVLLCKQACMNLSISAIRRWPLPVCMNANRARRLINTSTLYVQRSETQHRSSCLKPAVWTFLNNLMNKSLFCTSCWDDQIPEICSWALSKCCADRHKPPDHTKT